MKQVSGFLSDDGNFFESALAAREHDAEMAIRNYCVSHTPDGKEIPKFTLVDTDPKLPRCIDADKILTIIEALADPIMEYVNAQREKSAAVEKVVEERLAHPKAPAPVVHQGDDEGADEDATVQQFPFDGHEPVSDLGNRPLTEKL